MKTRRQDADQPLSEAAQTALDAGLESAARGEIGPMGDFTGEPQRPRPASPILKWAGGKRQLLPLILPRLPAKIATYYEPFIGGGAVFFALANEKRFERAVIGDANVCLVNVYQQVRDEVESVIGCLRFHEEQNSEQHFYKQRAMALLHAGPRDAARFIYLNRTCFNGLYRVNSKGEFNVSWGKYAKPRIVDADGLEAASEALQGVEIRHADFAKVVIPADKGDAVFFDPPYVPASKVSSFVGFQSDGFNTLDQERLADILKSVASRGAAVLLSNSDTIESRRIYGVPGNTVEAIQARRNINSSGDKRGPVGEILVSVPMVSAPKTRGKVAA